MDQNQPQEAFSTENIFLKLHRFTINSSQVTSFMVNVTKTEKQIFMECLNEIELYVLK